ncbi:anhydro-N-acetylmuramic acid kinase [Arsukibacterium sp.]|uniref:anhydro-N-acetylmuramic acid kinase n=1 Tax=Arsukibacterium sp. TaxID=1977258 RepID=UPI002FD8C413
MLYMGIMSGTSLDGIDVVLADIGPHAISSQASLLIPFSPALRQSLQQLSQPGNNEIELLGPTELQLAEAYAGAVAQLLQQAGVKASAITAIGCHGQTIRHRPDGQWPFSYQIGDMHKLAMLSQLPVIADFRRKDIAYGGQGAPLVPAFHRAVFHQPGKRRAIINIGGIANVTLLLPDNQVLGFDSGPGNALMDNWMQQINGQAYDQHGQFAASGQWQPALLQAMLQEPYFARPAPKSTGREVFNLNWLQQFSLSQLGAADVQRTLCRLTAQSIVDSLDAYQPEQLYICGGGVHNKQLMADLAELQSAPVLSTEELGIAPDWVEAMAFAWLAYAYEQQIPGNLPEVTGASKACVLGVKYLP